MSIKLDELLNHHPEELPDWIHSENVIYKITNTINGKSYIGQAKYLYGRFVGNRSYLTYTYCIANPSYRSYIINAIRKYGAQNFEVSILMKDCTDLDAEEIRLIKFHGTYYKGLPGGYNILLGGNDGASLASHAHDKLKILYPDTNGAPPNWIKAGRDKLKELYPNTNGAPVSFLVSNKNITEESIRKRSEAGSITRLIKSITTNIEILKEKNLDLTISNFKEHTNARYNGYRGYRNIINKLDQLKSDPRWSTEMDLIFK